MTTMKEAFHEQYGGSPKHDAVPELFAAGWNAVIEACGGEHHIVRFDEDERFTIQHPITERLEGSLFDCTIHQLVSVADGIFDAGDYRMWIDRSALMWEEVG